MSESTLYWQGGGIMMEILQPYIADYSYVGDITVMAMCIVILILLFQTYLHKTHQFRLLLGMIASIIGSCSSNMLFESYIRSGSSSAIYPYIFRMLHYLLLLSALFLYTQYLRDPLWMPGQMHRKYLFITIDTLIAGTIVDIIATRFKFGFYIDSDGLAHSSFNIFAVMSLPFIVTIFFLIINYRSRIIKQIFYSLMGVNIVSILMLSIQGYHNNSSYTNAACFFSVIGIMFMFHSNPYDIDTGAVSGIYLNDEIESTLEKGRNMILLCCSIKGFTTAVRQSNALRYEYHKFFRQNIKKGILYHFSGDRMVLTIKKQSNTNYNRQIEAMMNQFLQIHKQFGLKYKIIIMETMPEVLDVEVYQKALLFIEKNMRYNESHHVTPDDIIGFYDSGYILSQLEDIAARKSIDDERVEVYCQPVYNIAAGKYDTAEALMRLKLPKTGMVYPDQFIPLAEQNNIIHWLSMIILSKTCAAIRRFMDEGFEISRISVNFSVLDLRYDSFCSEVKEIIDHHGIPYDKIAMEITESRSSEDFHLMKQRVLQLRELGIKFYLDDFGTGYSNFERIMEIPFDIIKFDRIMLIGSSKSRSSGFMVSTFAQMFNRLNYSVLFEGVEDDSDEKKCISMNARYLQGYKYSRPIPINNLRRFLVSRSG